MGDASRRKINRRSFLKRSALAAGAGAAVGGAGYWLGSNSRVSQSSGKKVIVIGIDGMDPVLTKRMMNERDERGRPALPNLARLRDTGGFSRLDTSIPPQSPVAWANFINGAGPGSHGIFDFVHRHPHEQCAPFFSAAETIPGTGYWEIGDHRLPQPFNHQPPATLLRRQGVPFWDYLDEAGIPSTFYDLPSNYPASPSHHGHHRCISGMGTPDMVGSYGTYQHFAEDGPVAPLDERAGGGRRCRLLFSGETARATLVGPQEPYLQQTRSTGVEFVVHRDRESSGAVIDIQGRRIMLKAGDWSRWIKLTFQLDAPWFTPSFVLAGNVSGICRFYLQEVAPNFRLYVTPINFDPSQPGTTLSEPPSFIQDVSSRLGLFYTTGFQEDHKARSNNVFVDDEFIKQASMVLEERLRLFDYAVQNYDDGLLFFYFSSSDLQSHIMWWDSDAPHPTRSPQDARRCFGHVRQLYQRLDTVVGDIVDRYGSQATIIVMSDHGFANFQRQFNLNSWLREATYLGPRDCTSIMHDVDWSRTTAYGLGINGLYLNMKGRERDGIVEPGDQRETLLRELVSGLEAVRDTNGRRVIRNVYRADRVYQGTATGLAPDLIVGYARGYRASWATCLGELTADVLLDNKSAWSADHCADALEVPGVLFSNRPIRTGARPPALIDVAPSILTEYGLPIPSSMVGKSFFAT